MNSNTVKALLGKLETKYGAQVWRNTFPEGPPLDDWERELIAIPPEAVKHAMGRLHEKNEVYPPTAMQFAGLCRSHQTSTDTPLESCKIQQCPMSTTHLYCEWHKGTMSHQEEHMITQALLDNREIVRYMHFLEGRSLAELLNPREGYRNISFFNWPPSMLEMWDTIQPEADEKPGEYLSRIQAMTRQLIKPRLMNPHENPQANDDYGQDAMNNSDQRSQLAVPEWAGMFQ